MYSSYLAILHNNLLCKLIKLNSTLRTEMCMFLNDIDILFCKIVVVALCLCDQISYTVITHNI